jgi:mitogen-activated protein kinase 1/3
MRQELM